MKLVGIVTVLALSCASLPAHALCIYNGVNNAKTTIAEEFKDSIWVIRGKVLAASDHVSDDDESWTLYRIEVLHAYKGHPPKTLPFFTFRDSGGFYMDRPWARLPAGHDVGGDYLLFLNPLPIRNDFPPQARDASFVNYSCGVSGPWPSVSLSDRNLLSALEQGR
ncbi:MAG TPA: hypothetical protein VHZ26_10395 [Caulobacteraceae bacterium]|jgi:hypothetical protein|nr:hypothetical protein [Caulobacteraceae bacterium]